MTVEYHSYPNPIDPAALKAAFAGYERYNGRELTGGFSCAKMLRAWRNRSNVTRWAWEAIAAKALNDRRYAAALYVACGEFCDPSWDFEPHKWPPAYWESLANRLPHFILFPPEKALSRGEWEQRQKAQSRA
jgi:hypothetical protein